MSFDRYPEYRDSDIPWLGKIPADWKMLPFFSRFTERKESNKGMKSINLLSLSYGRIVRKDIEGLDGLLPESFETYQVVHRGDIVFRLTDLQNDKRSLRSAIVSESGIITSAYLAVSAGLFDSTFASYLFRAYDLLKVFYSMGGGLRQSMKYADMKWLPIAAPSIEEQTQIARFLDHETAKIDALIREQERLIKLLEEKRQAVISHAVTKGLDPEVPMKDSGVEWLGDVPEHWACVKLNYRYKVELGKMLDEKKQAKTNLFPYFRNRDVQWGEVNTGELPKISLQRHEVDRFTVKKGDLLVCEGGEVGRAAIWTGCDKEYAYQKALHRVRPREEEKDAPEFLFLVLFTAVHRGVFEQSEAKATIAHLPAEQFRQYRFAFPPQPEQISICNYVKARDAQLTELIRRTEQSVELLRERRASLISTAVTGKIDVRNWEPPRESAFEEVIKTNEEETA